MSAIRAEELASGERRTLLRLRYRFHLCSHRQRDCEDRASARGRGGFDVPSMLAQHGLADAQAKASAAAGPPGGEERIKNVRQVFGCDSWTVILKDDPHRLAIASDADTNRAFLAAFPHRLFRIQQKIQEHLHQ